MNKQNILDYIDDRLKDDDLERILEDFDLEAREVFYILWKEGHIDENLIILECH